MAYTIEEQKQAAAGVGLCRPSNWNKVILPQAHKCYIYHVAYMYAYIYIYMMCKYTSYAHINIDKTRGKHKI